MPVADGIFCPCKFNAQIVEGVEDPAVKRFVKVWDLLQAAGFVTVAGTGPGPTAIFAGFK